MGRKLGTEINFSYDIEIISETWGACENCKSAKITGYELVKSTDPEKKGKKGGSSGGIQVYCKNFLENKIKIIKTSDKYIWMEIEKTLFNSLDSNLKICAIYKTSSIFIMQ